jgi:Zn-dependent peptidase ImmA (M78 family)
MFKRAMKYIHLSPPHKLQIEAEAEQFSIKIRKQLGLSLEQPIDIIRLIEEHFKVYIFQLIDLQTSGFVRVIGQNKIIFINASEPLGRQYYTAAHELCHILKDLDNIKKVQELDEKERNLALDEMEYFAYKFADYFLAPKTAIGKVLQEMKIQNFSKIEPSHVFFIQERFKISYRQAVRLLHKFGVITDKQREELSSISNKENPEQLVQLMQNSGYSTELVKPLTESKIPSIFLNSIVSNIENKRISSRKVEYLEEILHLHLRDENGLAL